MVMDANSGDANSPGKVDVDSPSLPSDISQHIVTNTFPLAVTFVLNIFSIKRTI